MTRTPKILLALVLLLLLGALILFGKAFFMEPREEGAAARGPELTSDDSRSDWPVARASQKTRSQAVMGRSLVAALDGPEYGARIRVVRASDKQPVPAASIVIMGVGKSSELDTKARRRGQRDRRLQVLVARAGKVRATDVDGFVRAFTKKMKSPGQHMGWVTIVAWKGKAFGWKQIWWPKLRKDVVFDLVIEEDYSFEVEVVDHEGRPAANVPMMLSPLSPGHPTKHSLNFQTDEHGLGRIGHLRSHMRDPNQHWALHADLPFLVASPIIFTYATRKPRYRLRLPPTGAMEFHVRAADGRRIVEPSKLTLIPERQFMPIEGSYVQMTKLRSESHEGLFRFERVGLGLKVRAGVNIMQTFSDEPQQLFSGPQVAGETVKHVVVLAKKGLSIRGRVFLGGKKLPRGAMLMSRLLEKDRFRWYKKSPVIVPGDFSLFAEFRKAGPASLLMRTEIAGKRYYAWPSFEIKGPGARIELGRVELEAGKPLVAGRVVDERGRPIAAAFVRLRRIIEDYRGRPTGAPMTSDNYKTDADGRFRFEGAILPGPYEIFVMAEGFGQHVRPVEIGDLKRIIRLLPEMSVDVRLQLPVGFKERVYLSFEPLQSGQRPRRARKKPDAKGSLLLRCSRLQRGLYDLEVRIDSWPKPIWKQHGFRVESDEQLYPETIDLRGVLHRFEFRIAEGLEYKSGGEVRIKQPLGPKGAKLDDRVYSLARQTPVYCVLPSLEYLAVLPGYKPIASRASPGLTSLRFELAKAYDFEVVGLAALLKKASQKYPTKYQAALLFKATAKAARRSRPLRLDLQGGRGQKRFSFEERSYDVTLDLSERLSDKARERAIMKRGNLLPHLRIALGKIVPTELPPNPGKRFAIDLGKLEQDLQIIRDR